MNVAIIQPVPAPSARLAGAAPRQARPARAAPAGGWRLPYRFDVAALAAALRARGHNVSLTILDTCDESALAAQGRPEIAFIYIEGLAADLAVRLAGTLAAVHGAPLVPFGPHASYRPDDCLSLPGAEAVLVGPADLAAAEYLARRTGLDHARTPGFWVKCAGGVMRNPPPHPPASLARSPPPARDLYPTDLLVDAAGFAEVHAARGGEADGAAPPAAGGARVPPPAPAEPCWPPTAAWPVLHRPVEAVIDEMRGMADMLLDLGGFRIGNERWASAPGWLARFAERYPREIRLPIRTTLRAADVTPQAAALLARAGCEEVRIRVGSGSALIRHDVLGLGASVAALEAAFAALRSAGIRSAAAVELGTPYETPASLEQTVEFLRRLEPDRALAALHFPAPGTPSDRIARENGWLVPDAASAHLAGGPAVALPRLSAEDLVAACEELPYAVVRPRVVPLIRLARRVRIGRLGTLYELAVKPFLAPAVRRTK